MTQPLTFRTWSPIQVPEATEAAICLRVAELELSGDPVDQMAAMALRTHFDLDDVWIEDAKIELRNK